MQIHFVSYGHAYRSRLAEAYLRFLLRKHKDIKITSSGIHPENDVNGPITWYAMRILTQHALVSYMTLEPILTSKKMLEEATKTVFVDRYSFEYCRRKFNFTPKEFDIWDLDYILLPTIEIGSDINKDVEIIRRSENTFAQIQDHCRNLYNDLSVTEIPFDI